MRMRIVLLLSLLLVGCTFEIDQKEYKAAVDRYCKNCGGTSTAFINEYGQEISCVDGHNLSQHWTSPPRNLVMGECK